MGRGPNQGSGGECVWASVPTWCPQRRPYGFHSPGLGRRALGAQVPQRTRSREVKAGEPNRVGGQGRVSVRRFQRGQRAGKGCNQGEQKTSRGAQFLGEPHLGRGVVMKTERQGLNKR